MFRQADWIIAVVVVWCISSSLSPAAASEKDATKRTKNANSLIEEYRDKLTFSCSSFWPTWGPERAFDGDPLKSWFTQQGDAAALGRKPWVAVEFPQAVTVRRVTLLCNREPPWQVGYTILVGRVELLDKDGKVLYTRDDEVGGERPDMEVRPGKPVTGVHKIRFTSLKDEGDKNPFEDIAIGEILVE
jgi:hypothetical protein